MVDQASSLRSIIDSTNLFRANQDIKVITNDYETGVEIKLNSKIKAVYDNSIIISMPYYGESYFPLENLSSIKINIHNSQDIYFTANIIDRRLTPVPVLVVSHPKDIKTLKPIPFEEPCRLIAITSGKGGVGKTSFSVNLAIALSRFGKKTLIFDADIGLANVDVILGLRPKYNLFDIINKGKSLKDIVYDGPEGIKLVASGSGIDDIFDLKEKEFKNLVNGLQDLRSKADVVLLDTGAGISPTVTRFLHAADEIVFVTTPEPTSITDTYALIKIITKNDKHKEIKLVINKAENQNEAVETARKLQTVCNKFLKKKLTILGYIEEDINLPKSIKEQNALIMEYPNSPATKGIMDIASNIINDQIWNEKDNHSSLSRFIERFKSFFG